MKLFEDRNYDAARAEFRAAYEARPKANPLINIALAHKAEFNYPKAIEALETALAKHRDSMGAGDIKAAEGELKDMRALLARVKLVVSPPNARVTIDGEALPRCGPRAADPARPRDAQDRGVRRGFRRARAALHRGQRRVDRDGAEARRRPGDARDRGAGSADDDRRRSTRRRYRHVDGAAPAGLAPRADLRTGGQPFAADILVVAGKPLTVRPAPGSFPPVPPLPSRAKIRHLRRRSVAFT